MGRYVLDLQALDANPAWIALSRQGRGTQAELNVPGFVRNAVRRFRIVRVCSSFRGEHREPLTTDFP
jgi:hypothetical protein